MNLPRKEQIAVFDIETVPMVKDFEDLDPEFLELWLHKAAGKQFENMDPSESFASSASFFAEFSKVVCVSIGMYRSNGVFAVKAIASENEGALLGEFAQILNSCGNKCLVGHNIFDYDLPYMCKKYIIHGQTIPRLLDISGLKPWEIPHIDTMKFWQFGSFGSKTSLALMAGALGVPSPKGDMDGSKVGAAYYNGELEKIREYNIKDIVAVAQCYQKFKGESIEIQAEIIE